MGEWSGGMGRQEPKSPPPDPVTDSKMRRKYRPFKNPHNTESRKRLRYERRSGFGQGKSGGILGSTNNKVHPPIVQAATSNVNGTASCLTLYGSV